MTEMREKPWEERAQELGACTYSSLEEMVAALKCDYERLEELKEEREELEEALSDAKYDEDAEEISEATAALREWDEENAEEFKELKDAAGDCEDEDQARERIQEDPLSVQVRSGWASCKEEFEAEEFEILLGTGGPAMRLIGDLDYYNSPCNVRLQVQDWFQPWTDYRGGDSDVLEAYCKCFYFGD